MRKLLFYSPLVLVISVIVFSVISDFNTSEEAVLRYKKNAPGNWFFYQRAFPVGDIPYEKFYAAMEEKKVMEQMDNPTSGLNWISKGPYNVGGRITAIAVHPSNPDIIIIGAAAGGIFKTTNGGMNWSAKTDEWPSLSIGSLVMHPSNPNIIYCGTGEGNSAIDVYPGFGVLKSTDMGETWNVIGLTDALHIPAMDIHPLDPNTLYASVMSFRSFGQNKGIYKSTNGGVNWNRVLFVSDSTSGVDVRVSPDDLNIVYAAMWERVRTPPSVSKTGGITSGLYRSSNAGANWQLLGVSQGIPAPAATTGRISIAVAQSNPNVVYSIFKTTTGNNISGIYKSTNKGLNWATMSMSGVQSSGFDWYFGLIEVDPTNPNTVYIGSVDIFRTTNGSNWVNLTNSYSGSFDQQHPDQHVLWINPANPNNLINGNDGGIFKTGTGNAPWTKSYDLPISQFYASNIDHLNPVRKIGGTQDNGSMITFDGGTDNWEVIYGGDGFTAHVDYTNSNIIYCASQNGGLGRSTNNGVSFSNITNGLSGRFNWSTPYILDNQDPAILYAGSHMIFRSTNRGTSWTAISGDLTRGPNGRLGTITCITSGVAGNNQRVIYTGTDDAKISVTTNSGANWLDVTGSLPQRYVTDIRCDSRNPAIAYVTLSGFNIDERNTRIYRTTNYGSTWSNISGNLLNVPANSIIVDEVRDSVLYVGCDAGVYYTSNLGASWAILGTGLPNAPVFDINYHAGSQILCAGTHGRSIFEISTANIPIGIVNNSEIAESFLLGQNFPNPFNPVTNIKFSIPKADYVRLIVYDIRGSEVALLINKNMPKGEYTYEFDASNLPSGVYFYTLRTEKFTSTKKMILVK
ncbi:MAG: T9SS type A sorting domain-containing protein [Ignavibacteria bacterium]|nr:T9SS type A sorting domain-containing protein [Ignavibacteria bacterium]